MQTKGLPLVLKASRADNRMRKRHLLDVYQGRDQVLDGLIGRLWEHKEAAL
jgi:hypothetical protein